MSYSKSSKTGSSKTSSASRGYIYNRVRSDPSAQMSAVSNARPHWQQQLQGYENIMDHPGNNQHRRDPWNPKTDPDRFSRDYLKGKWAHTPAVPARVKRAQKVTAAFIEPELDPEDDEEILDPVGEPDDTGRTDQEGD